MQTVVWVHGDMLNPKHPALVQNADAQALYVWDDALLREYEMSFKRVVFIYECLLELPVVIRRGEPAAEVLRFAAEHGASRIVTGASVSPRFIQLCATISAGLGEGGTLDVVAETPFVTVSGPLDLKRFARYWQQVRDVALNKGDIRR
jgi:nucleotide-binding universal stress UspA family protein